MLLPKDSGPPYSKIAANSFSLYLNLYLKVQKNVQYYIYVCSCSQRNRAVRCFKYCSVIVFRNSYKSCLCITQNAKKVRTLLNNDRRRIFLFKSSKADCLVFELEFHVRLNDYYSIIHMRIFLKPSLTQ